MKYLKPLILESKQVGIIYHFTGIWNLYEMLKFDDFRIKTGYNYISFTRNPIMFSPELLQSKLQTRIMIDGNKLSNKYKISPFKDKMVDKEHGEWEERVKKENDLFKIRSLDNVNISDCILEIDIIDEPLFRGKEDKYYKNYAKYFTYDPYNSSIDDTEKIITKHSELLDKIGNEIEIKKFSFDINIVSRFINPKYQDKYIIKKLN